MDKKYTIGIIYRRDKKWIAGSYYIENLILALNTVKQSKKPILKIFTSNAEDFEHLRSTTKYPELLNIILNDNQNVLDKIINKISWILIKKHWIVKGIDHQMDVLFPAIDEFYFEKIKQQKKIYWIPDFQDKYFPNLFPKNDLIKREKMYNKYLKIKATIIFSSNDSLSDFNKFYKNHSCKTFTLPFAVTLPSLESIKFEELLLKYDIKEPYFICSNQFWAHKNHKLIFMAAAKLKQQNIDVSIVFTGLFNDTRNPKYTEELKELVNKENLNDNLKFIGFIDRKEQLVLMNNSIAVLQPSKFEGWSTVVEDTKALNCPIIVSDINVHREQLQGYPYFFNKDNVGELSELMKSAFINKLNSANVNYQAHIKEFGEKFLQIVDEVANIQ